MKVSNCLLMREAITSISGLKSKLSTMYLNITGFSIHSVIESKSRDRASASTFNFPGIWQAVSQQSWSAVQPQRSLTALSRDLDLQLPILLIDPTAAWLSIMRRKWQPEVLSHRLSKPNRTAIVSFTLMCNLRSASLNRPPVPSLSITAPHPWPEASVVSVIEGESLTIGAEASKMLDAHHAISSRVAWESMKDLSKFHPVLERANDLSLSRSLKWSLPKGTAKHELLNFPSRQAACLMGMTFVSRVSSQKIFECNFFAVGEGH